MSVSDALVLSAAAGALTFVVLYAVLAPFYMNEAGWNVMVFMIIVAAMVCQSMYFRISGVRAPEWLSVLDWGLVSVVIWWRVTILVREQFRRRPPRE
jgi:hypothetical protein